MKKLFLLISLVAVLVLSACSAPASPAQSQPQATPPVPAAGQPQPRSITVSGTGQVTLSPDVAYVFIGVNSQAENVADALTQNNDKANAVASALKELGIDPKDIQTSSFNIYPQQQYDPQGQITGTTYSVNNVVNVTVRDLDLLGRLLDVVVRSGANNINGITFDVLDKSQALSEARRLAVESSRSQADEIAQAAGVSLGDLQNLSVFTNNSPSPIYEGKGALAADAAQVPVSAGQMIIRVDITATYTIQ